MNISELKELITGRNLGDDLLIFKLTDQSSEFIANQYIWAIAKIKHLEVKYISDFSEITQNPFLVNNYLYIYKVDNLTESPEEIDNVIVICNKTSVEEAIEIPKLENWQFLEYLYKRVEGINHSDLQWLITQYEQTESRVTQTNYFRLANDLDKIRIFPESLRQPMFEFLYDHGEYSTISNLTMFDLSNAIIKRDTQTVLAVLKAFDYIDSEPQTMILSLLINNFYNVLNIQTNPKITANELGISDKQLYAIKKNNIGYYTTDQLIKIYSMLCNIEYLYKFGGLSTSRLADYIICSIFSV